MKKYKQFYVWTMNAKLFMGIYYSAIVFLTGVLLACFGEYSMKLLTLVEMLGVAMFVALMQVALLPDSTDFMKGIFCVRSLIWLVLSGVAVGFIAQIGAWFAGLPTWCPWVLALVMMVGCVASLIGLRWEQEQDTVHLNSDLENYKQK